MIISDHIVISFCSFVDT